MIKIEINHRNKVDASASIDLNLSTSVIWGQMRDISHFLTIDPLHFRVRVEGQENHLPTVGTDLIIEHRFLGLGPDRRSRVLRWREGEGYAVSDLSKRGTHCGFPHVCVFELMATSETTSRLLIAARGRWTATWIPKWMIRLWLWWVLKSTAIHITRHFELYELVMRRRGVRLLSQTKNITT